MGNMQNMSSTHILALYSQACILIFSLAGQAHQMMKKVLHTGLTWQNMMADNWYKQDII